MTKIFKYQIEYDQEDIALIFMVKASFLFDNRYIGDDAITKIGFNLSEKVSREKGFTGKTLVFWLWTEIPEPNSPLKWKLTFTIRGITEYAYSLLEKGRGTLDMALSTPAIN